MLIGIAGKKQSGKSSVANYLVQTHGFVRIRFAGPLKDMMRALGLSEEEIDGKMKEKPSKILGGQTPRYAMQTLGTEWGRHMIHPGIWTESWFHKYEAALALGMDVVVDDVRFSNEAALIQHLDGRIVNIFRPITKDLTDMHASEQFDFQSHWELLNTGDLPELYRKVEDIFGLEIWDMKGKQYPGRLI